MSTGHREPSSAASIEYLRRNRPDAGLTRPVDADGQGTLALVGMVARSALGDRLRLFAPEGLGLSLVTSGEIGAMRAVPGSKLGQSKALSARRRVWNRQSRQHLEGSWRAPLTVTLGRLAVLEAPLPKATNTKPLLARLIVGASDPSHRCQVERGQFIRAMEAIEDRVISLEIGAPYILLGVVEQPPDVETPGPPTSDNDLLAQFDEYVVGQRVTLLPVPETVPAARR